MEDIMKISRAIKTERLVTLNTLLRKKRPYKKAQGFTFIELVAVLFIISVLAGLGFLIYRNYLHQAYNAVAFGDIRRLEKEIFNYGVDKSVLIPPDLAAINFDGLLDPWGNPYVYQPDLTINPRTKAGTPINTLYDLYSMGKDGQTAPALENPLSQDDIVSAGDGQYVGLVEGFD